MPDIRNVILLGTALALASLSFAVPSLASERWSYERADVSGTEIHMAVTSSQFHGVGLRCDGGVLSIQYLTNDPMNEAQMRDVNASGVGLSLTLGGETQRIAGEMQRVPQGAVFVALAEPELIAALEKERGELELSIAVGGRATHQRSFTLDGSAEPLRTLRRNCPT